MKTLYIFEQWNRHLPITMMSKKKPQNSDLQAFDNQEN